MRKMRRIPAAIEKVPNVVKNETNVAPDSSASSIASCLTVSTSRSRAAASGSRIAATSPESSAPPNASPVLAIERLSSGERHQEGGVRGGGSVEPDDVAHAHLTRVPVCEHDEAGTRRHL